MKKTNKLSIAEMKTALRGRRYEFFSGWNSTFRTFIITSVRHYGNSKGKYYVLMGVAKSNPDFRYEETITYDCIQGLIDNGQYSRLNEVDYCQYRDRYRVFNN